MKIKTFWNTTLEESLTWPEWVFVVWCTGQIALYAGVIVGVVLLVCANL